MRARDALIAAVGLVVIVAALLLQRCGRQAPAPVVPTVPAPAMPVKPAAKPRKPGKRKEPPAVFITFSTHDGPRSWTVSSRKNRPDSEIALCFHHPLAGDVSQIGVWKLDGRPYVWWGMYGVGSVPDDASERCSVLIDTREDLLQARGAS